MTSNKPGKRLFIGSLPYKFSEGELLSLFISEGKIISVKIVKNRWGKSRGMGYVEYELEADAVRAKNKYHNYRLDNRTIIVDFAQPDPFLTAEGQERHRQAEERRITKRKKFAPKRFNFDSDKEPNTGDKKRSSFGFDFKSKRKGDSSQATKPEASPSGKKYPSSRMRQTVFESRYFGSRSGAKFAAKSKARKKNK